MVSLQVRRQLRLAVDEVGEVGVDAGIAGGSAASAWRAACMPAAVSLSTCRAAPWVRAPRCRRAARRSASCRSARMPSPSHQAKVPSSATTRRTSPMHQAFPRVWLRKRESPIRRRRRRMAGRLRRRRAPRPRAPADRPDPRPAAPAPRPTSAARRWPNSTASSRRAHTGALRRAEVVEHHRLDANQGDPRREAVADAGQGQQFLEGRQCRLIAVAVPSGACRRGTRGAFPRQAESIASRTTTRSAEHTWSSKYTLRAAVDDRHVGRHLPASVQRLDRAHAEALVGPGTLPMPSTSTSGAARPRFGADAHRTLSAWRRPAVDHRADDGLADMMSSRTTMYGCTSMKQSRYHMPGWCSVWTFWLEPRSAAPTRRTP